MIQKTLKVSKHKYNDSFVPKIRLSGLWLNQIGFTSKKQIEVNYSREQIKISLFDPNKPFETEKALKILVSNSSGGKSSDGSIRVVPEIKINGIWLNQIGFKIDDKVIVTYDYGTINISLSKP